MLEVPHGTITVIWSPEMDARLCDLVAEDCYSFGQIARMMGLGSRHSVTSRWRRIVQNMGWQAA